MNTRELADATAIKFNEALRDSYSDLSVGHRRLLATMINSALQQAIAAERERQWQPIETAPRDGRSFLVAIEGLDLIDRAFYMDDHLLIVGGRYEPTHWMPMVDPPAIRRDSTGEEGS